MKFVAIIAIMAAAIASFKMYETYKGKVAYSELIEFAKKYKLYVVTCLQRSQDITVCDSGAFGIPAAGGRDLGRFVDTVLVTDGVILVTPRPPEQTGIPNLLPTDTLILSPSVNVHGPGQTTIDWSASGGGADKLE